MFAIVIFIAHVCMVCSARDRYNNKDCRAANLPLQKDVDFRKYPDFTYHQLIIGNSENVISGGVSFITKLTDNTVSIYAAGRTGINGKCDNLALVILRNFPTGSADVRLTDILEEEPTTITVWIAATDYKNYLMFYICPVPLDRNGACPPGQSRLLVETTATRISNRIFKLAQSVASKLCIDPNEVANLRTRPTCPKVRELIAKNERRIGMRKRNRGYGYST